MKRSASSIAGKRARCSASRSARRVAVATALLHVPAGLGVAEAVFVAVLAGGAPEPRILAALLAWRAAYYLVPLVAAVAFYVGVEARAGAGTVSRG